MTQDRPSLAQIENTPARKPISNQREAAAAARCHLARWRGRLEVHEFPCDYCAMPLGDVLDAIEEYSASVGQRRDDWWNR